MRILTFIREYRHFRFMGSSVRSAVYWAWQSVRRK